MNRFQFFYTDDVRWIVILFLICLLLWILVLRKFRAKSDLFYCVCIVFSALSLLSIALLTIFGRVYTGEHFVIWDLYYSSDIFVRDLVLNVMLYVPLGLFMPFAVEYVLCQCSTVCSRRKFQPYLISIIFSLLFSLCVEFWQYACCMGQAQTDDVLCNVAGCAFGGLIYLFSDRISVSRNK